jgi:hypothetical protein
MDYGPTPLRRCACSLIGAPIADSMAMIATSFQQRITLGTPHGRSSDDWFRSYDRAVVQSGLDPIPDAHFSRRPARGAKGRQHRARLRSSTSMTRGSNPRPGTDAALALAAA